ncbi:DUF1983 domain-containing protein [Escherichia coli]|nr:ClpP-like prohead protease/major capsid protein fusion protein [Escherichia coli]NJZ44161.1 DUF1983 domain-containing protein [Escherichia coli]
MPQRNDRSRSTPTTSPKINSWFRMQAGHQSDADIYIYDEIGFWGVTAKQFISDLNALGDITHINLHINSPGGDVFEGIAIFNALKTHGASITVYVDGVAASMASVIAMVGNPVIMPENTFMMIHKPFGFTGGDAEDMRTYADLLDKVEAVLLPAYAQKTGKTTDEIAAMLADETWMSGAECLAHGFADQVTPAVKAMACIQSKRTEEFKKMPESIRNMITPPRNSAPRVQDDEPAASRTPVQAAAPVVDENSIRAQVLAEQKARVNGINDLFAMFGGRYQTLQAQCLADPECSLEQAREKLLNEMGRESTPSNKNTPAHIYAGNGNFVGDGIRQALMARAGFEKTERDNVYNGMTLREYARMSLTERGIGVSGYNPMQMVGAAFTHSTSDFGNILLDVANKAILQGWEDAPETYEQWTRKGQLSDFKIAHRVGMGGFSALRQVREGAEYKYVTTGDKQATIALATYGELFSITRQAIINDDLNMLTDVPMKLGRAAKSTIRTGGRVLAVNSQTRTLTLDREITLPSSGTTLISLVDGQGSPVSVEVQSVTDGVKVKVSRVPDGVAEYSVWGLKLPTLRQRLFRCVSIRENDDGTYAITAVQHVPEKEAIVDNGAHFDGDQSGTVNGVTPPAVQHLTAEVTADSGEYQVLARWDTPKVVKGVSFLLRLTVAADDGRERLVSTARTTETTYRFTQLALGNYRLTVRAVNAWGQQGDPASVSFRIAAPAAPSRIELTPGYFQITATPHLAVYDPTVQFEFWFSEKRIADIRQVETSARYLGTALYWIAASINIKPGHDYYFYVRSVNTVGKSAFVEAVGQPSDDASGYLDFFKGEIGKTHLAQELWTQIDNGQLAPDLAEIRTSITDVSNEITQTVNKKLEDQSAAIQQIQKVQVDTNNNLNSMWAVKLQQMKDGRLYIAGIGAGIENTPAGMQSQVLLAADRIAMINPANGNTKPMFVGQGDQIFMNEVFLKRLTAPTITSGGNPPAFSLTPDGKLTAKNADISGSVNANSGTLNNVTINENCQIKGKLSANQIEGDIVKTVGKAFPRDSRAPERWPSGTITVRIYDDQPFDRQIVIPAVAFSGAKHEREHTDIYSSCRLIVKKNGAEIYNRTALDNTLIYSGVIDMPAGHGHMTLEFSVSAWLVNDWYPTASISDLLVVVMKKATAGISIS